MAMTYDVINGVREYLGELNPKTTLYLANERQKDLEKERKENAQKKQDE